MAKLLEFLKSCQQLVHFLRTHRLKPQYRRRFIALLVVFGVVLFGVVKTVHVITQWGAPTTAVAEQKTTKADTAKKTSVKPKKATAPKKTAAQTKAKTVDWTKPSESKAYPDVSKYQNLELQVNLKRQRVYVKSGSQVLYTMYASSGMNNSTPTGTYKIGSRGYSFYNPTEKMGAHYWTAFIGTTYLFHSVPTDSNGNYITSEAVYLGKRPSSHGCVRLSIPDAKWINEKIPTGTKVVIG
jgi:lipoprotein-anchoring transpeptidase ErfK/SrfK